MILRLWPWAADVIAERYEAVVEEIERRHTFTRREVAEALNGRIAYPHPAVTVVVAELRAHGVWLHAGSLGASGIGELGCVDAEREVRDERGHEGERCLPQPDALASILTGANLHRRLSLVSSGVPAPALPRGRKHQAPYAPVLPTFFFRTSPV